MKIGLLTFHFETNYGALLQAFAMQSTLEALGHSCQVINYVPEAYRQRYSRPSRFWRLGWRHDGVAKAIHKASILARSEVFRQRHLNLSQVCHTREDLKCLSATFDAVIVGSDQVWNWGWAYGFDPAYLLDFVGRRKCRGISYAACAGQSRSAADIDDTARRLLASFHRISIRDQMSAQWVSSLGGGTATIVADPTMLYDWSPHIGTSGRHRGSYSLVYSISRHSSSEQARIVEAIRKKSGLPVLAVWTDPLWHSDLFPVHDRIAYGVGPWQWLALIREASFVFTDSFHAAIFATRLGRPFAVYDEFETSRSARILDLFTRLHITDRLIRTFEDIDERRLLEHPVSPEVLGGMELFRQQSIDFLKSALG